MSIPDPDPRPQPPIEPALEDCCGSGCPNCIFDVYQMLLANYKEALAAWEARHSEQSSGNDVTQAGSS